MTMLFLSEGLTYTEKDACSSYMHPEDFTA